MTELLWSARDIADFRATETALLACPWFSIEPRDWIEARRVFRELASAGPLHHRQVKVPVCSSPRSPTATPSRSSTTTATTTSSRGSRVSRLGGPLLAARSEFAGDRGLISRARHGSRAAHLSPISVPTSVRLWVRATPSGPSGAISGEQPEGSALRISERPEVTFVQGQDVTRACDSCLRTTIEASARPMPSVSHRATMSRAAATSVTGLGTAPHDRLLGPPVRGGGARRRVDPDRGQQVVELREHERQERRRRCFPKRPAAASWCDWLRSMAASRPLVSSRITARRNPPAPRPRARRGSDRRSRTAAVGARADAWQRSPRRCPSRMSAASLVPRTRAASWSA